MNKQTRAYRAKNLSTKVVKGATVPKAGNPMGESLIVVEFDSTKGRAVNSRKEREDGGRKPWKGGTAVKAKAVYMEQPEVEAALA